MNMGISIKNSASNNKFFSPIQTPKFISNYQKYNLFKNTLSTKKGDVPIINISNEISSPRKSILSFDNSRKSCLILPEFLKYSNKSPKNSIFHRNSTFSSIVDNSDEKQNLIQSPKSHMLSFFGKHRNSVPASKLRKMLQQRALENSRKYSKTTSMFYRKLSHLRILPHFRLSTTKLSFLDGKSTAENQENNIQLIDFEGVLKLLNLEKPSINYKINILVIDEKTALPYTIIQSLKMVDNKVRNILIICNDYFDNFMNKYEYYNNYIKEKENFVIILFNYPCQMYSLYDKEIIYNNEYMAMCLDLLIFELSKKKYCHIRSDNISFLGFGFGCNTILTFLYCSYESIKTIKSCFFINCFLYLDENLMNFIEKSINILEKSNNNEYSFYFFQSILNKNSKSINLEDRYVEKKYENSKKLTSIALKTLLKGSLHNINLSQIIEKNENVSMIFINSINNTLISQNQFHFIEKLNESKTHKIPNFLNSSFKRLFICDKNSGYNIFEDNFPFISKLIQQFIDHIPKLENSQKIAFLDKLMLIIEETLMKFYENSDLITELFENERNIIENYSKKEKLIEISDNCKKIKTEIEGLESRFQNSQIIFEKNKKELDFNDDLIEKTVNIQQKKLNEFSKYSNIIEIEIKQKLELHIDLIKIVKNCLLLENLDSKKIFIRNFMKKIEKIYNICIERLCDLTQEFQNFILEKLEFIFNYCFEILQNENYIEYEFQKNIFDSNFLKVKKIKLIIEKQNPIQDIFFNFCEKLETFKKIN